MRVPQWPKPLPMTDAQLAEAIRRGATDEAIDDALEEFDDVVDGLGGLSGYDEHRVAMRRAVNLAFWRMEHPRR